MYVDLIASIHLAMTPIHIKPWRSSTRSSRHGGHTKCSGTDLCSAPMIPGEVWSRNSCLEGTVGVQRA